jgi:hypothetical protein
MTQAEEKRLAAVLHATEYLFLENMALKLVLEHRGVENWQKLVTISLPTRRRWEAFASHSVTSTGK